MGGVVLVGDSGVREGIRVRTRVGRGKEVCAVQVMMTNGDAVSVGVRVGVRVEDGMGEGTFEAVAEGAVAVGKGPRSAWEVRAMAVLVPLGSLSVSFPPGDLRTIAVATLAIRPTNKSPANNILKRAWFSSEILKFTCQHS